MYIAQRWIYKAGIIIIDPNFNCLNIPCFIWINGSDERRTFRKCDHVWRFDHVCERPWPRMSLSDPSDPRALSKRRTLTRIITAFAVYYSRSSKVHHWKCTICMPMSEEQNQSAETEKVDGLSLSLSHLDTPYLFFFIADCVGKWITTVCCRSRTCDKPPVMSARPRPVTATVGAPPPPSFLPLTPQASLTSGR